MRVARLVLFAAVGAITVACGHAAPPVTAVAPAPNADSLAAARAHEADLARARQDSIDRARQASERLAIQRRADSLAAVGRSTDAMKTVLETMTHFDFDQAAIRTGDAAILDQKLPVLRSNATIRIRITGNCDERGSAEYNLALGDRRALAAKQYLVERGIDANRIETVSNGEERPVDPGHNEQAWAMNRNDQFTVLNASVVLTRPS
jgi:peptidoglycan-associated lipoprotein